MKKRVIETLRNVFDGIMIFLLFITTTVYALPSNGVTYDGTNSGSSATTVNEALDDLYSKLNTKQTEIDRLNGIGTAAANHILKGYTALVKGQTVTGTIASKAATTYTPGTANQTIAAGQYLSGTQTIKGDANLVAANIAKGKSIFGVTGTYTSDANAAAGNILAGKTAYVNGSKITGTMVDRGLAQYGNFACAPNGCDSGGSAYYAINGLPEGWYHSDGNDWAPEARISATALRSALGISANKIAAGQSIAGIAGTRTAQNNSYGVKYYNFHQLGSGQTCTFSHNFTPTVTGKLIVFMSATRSVAGVSSAWGTRSVKVGGANIGATNGWIDDWQGNYHWITNVSANQAVNISTSIAGSGSSLTSCSLFVLYVE